MAPTERSERHRALYGSVDERADRLLGVLRERRDVVATNELAELSGMPPGMLGGALSRLSQRKDARRVGRRGWIAT